jgi:uncharacterized protein YecT (DUF1311 family)
MKKYCASFVLLLSFSSQSYAEEYEFKPECQENQIAWNSCANDYFKFYDQRLNKLYKEQLDYLKNGNIEYRKQLGVGDININQFKQAQLAWIKFRDADCLYEAGSAEGSGSGWPYYHWKCLGDRTKERTLQLERYLECRGGGCPI